MTQFEQPVHGRWGLLKNHLELNLVFFPKILYLFHLWSQKFQTFLCIHKKKKKKIPFWSFDINFFGLKNIYNL